MKTHSKSDAKLWERQLRWDLLERNLGPLETIRLDELRLVRRWMFSNRQGLESPFFADLRQLTNEYIAAVFTLQQANLRKNFIEKVWLARHQCAELASQPCDPNAAALGRTLGWFEETRQLASEGAALRAVLAHPNAQIVFSDALIARIMATQVSDVTETVPISDTVQVPGFGAFQRPRTMRVRGSAITRGVVALVPTPNDRLAELALKFDGLIDSTALGQTGPVTIRMVIAGSAQAAKPIYVSPRGLELGDTVVTPRVNSRVTGVTAGSDVVERIAGRRAEQPESRMLMNRRAHSATIQQLQTKLDQRVEEALKKMRADVSRVQSSLNEFQELTAPLLREGAAPRLASFTSTATAIHLNAYAEQRGQFAAAAPCPHDAISGDIQLRFHVSAFNNLSETITGGKTLDDKFFMKYAKVLHAELPLPLMVHSRAARWAFTMRKQRPIELVIPQLNHFDFVVRIDSVQINGRTTESPTVATIHYELRQDDLGEYALHRLGGLELQTNAPTEVRTLVREKVDAFFGSILNGAGVVIPEGGILAPLRRLQSRGIQAEHEWITIALDAPPAAIEEFLRFHRQPTNQL